MCHGEAVDGYSNSDCDVESTASAGNPTNLRYLPGRRRRIRTRFPRHDPAPVSRDALNPAAPRTCSCAGIARRNCSVTAQLVRNRPDQQSQEMRNGAPPKGHPVNSCDPRRSATQTETSDELAVVLDVVLRDVVEKTTTLANHEHQATTGVVVTRRRKKNRKGRKEKTNGN